MFVSVDLRLKLYKIQDKVGYYSILDYHSKQKYSISNYINDLCSDFCHNDVAQNVEHLTKQDS